MGPFALMDLVGQDVNEAVTRSVWTAFGYDPRFAVDAWDKGAASAADIDTAMRLGTNYPLGPLAWGQRWGPATVLSVLDAMQAWYGEDRYRPSAMLRRIAAAGGDLREN